MLHAHYVYDAWGNHTVVNDTETEIGTINPIRYRSYYYDTETKLYYLRARYYDPEAGRFISQDNISYLAPEHFSGLNLYAYCNDDPVTGYDPTGTWDWGKFWTGVGMVVTGGIAVALAVTTFGAGIPVAMAVVAGATAVAGTLTTINGVATIMEAGTDYNFVRDGVFQGNETAYNIYAGVTETIAAVGTITLGIYHHTGQYKAAKYGQKYLGSGYKKQGHGRWVSSDGMRQMRVDGPHMYKTEKLGNHINLDAFKVNYWENARASFNKNKAIHLIYKWFKLIIK